MARSKSAVLSPADKKAVVTDIKAKIKEAKAVDKAIATLLKDAEKEYKVSEKSYNTAKNEAAKSANTNAKAIAKLEADLESMQLAVQ